MTKPDTSTEKIERVLAVLQEAGQPLSTAELAERTGMNTSTVAIQLVALRYAGKAERLDDGLHQAVQAPVASAAPAEDAAAASGVEQKTKALVEDYELLRRLAQEIEARFAELERAQACWNEQARPIIERAEKRLRAFVPPFRPGDYARVVGKAGTVVVIACERAFGDWVVLARYPASERNYTYPADVLERVR